MNLIKLKKQKKWRIYINQYTYNFKIYRTINNFGRDIYYGETDLKEAVQDQSSLLVEIMSFKKKAKPTNPEKKQAKKKVINNLYAIFEDRERVLVAFESKMFPKKIQGAGFLDRTGDKVSDP